MARFFALGLLVLPIVEIALFIKVGQTIGLWPTPALVIGAALFGAMLLRQQSLSVVNQLRGNISAGQLPARTTADTMMIGLAGLLLILPGFLTDIPALALLLPPVRSWIYGGLASRVTVVDAASYRSQRDPRDGRIRSPGTIDLDEDDYRPK
ncbi:FxsA family protein [Devosia sp. A8/3-2]|nr:FxsA family protein [Devosia sp. A8/3-2]